MSNQTGELTVEMATELACRVGIISRARVELMKEYRAICAERLVSRPQVITYQIRHLVADIQDTMPGRAGSARRMDSMPRIPEIYETNGVYVARNGKGEVLYVGYSMNLQERFHQHVRHPAHGSLLGDLIRANKPDSLQWAVDFYPTADRKAGLELEKSMIRELKPLINKIHRR